MKKATKKGTQSVPLAVKKLFVDTTESINEINDRVNFVVKEVVDDMQNIEGILNNHSQEIEAIKIRTASIVDKVVEESNKKVEDVSNDMSVLQSAWKVMAQSVEESSRSNALLKEDVKSFDLKIESMVKEFNDRRQHYKDRLDDVYSKSSENFKRFKFVSKEIMKNLSQFKFEMWYFTVLVSSCVGIALGLLAVVSDKVL